MKEVVVNWFKLRSCGKCRGDLALDEGDWLCLQCGTYYYTGLYPGSGARPAPLTHQWASISDIPTAIRLRRIEV
jgi:hypothetical protein